MCVCVCMCLCVCVCVWERERERERGRGNSVSSADCWSTLDGMIFLGVSVFLVHFWMCWWDILQLCVCVCKWSSLAYCYYYYICMWICKYSPYSFKCVAVSLHHVCLCICLTYTIELHVFQCNQEGTCSVCALSIYTISLSRSRVTSTHCVTHVLMLPLESHF